MCELKAFGVKDFYELQYLGDPSFSPDGERVAFLVKKVNEEGDCYFSDVHLLEKGKTRNMTEHGGVRNYVWSDQGRLICSFPSDKKDESYFKELSPETGQVLKEFWIPLAAASLTSLGDDCYVALGRFDNHLMDRGEQPRKVTMLTEIPYWGEFGLGYTSGTRKRLGIFDAKTGEWKYITPPMFEVVRIEVAHGKIAIVGMEYFSKGTRMYSLSLYDFEKDELKEVIPQDRMHIFYAAPLDDKILFCGNFDNPLEPKREDHDFYVIDPETGDIEFIEEYDHNIGGGNVATDAKLGGGRGTKLVGNRLYFLATRGNDIGLYSISALGDLREEDRRKGVILGFDWKDEKLVTCSMYENRPAELYLDGEQVTFYNEDWCNKRFFSKSQAESVRTSDDFEIHGWVMKPINYQEGEKYPAILHIHGGPPVIFSDILFYEHQLWVAQGYFVIFCNPRGSDGRGFEFRNLTGKYGDWDYHSLMDYLDEILSRYPDIDNKRLGVTGGSYGGYMTNWIIGQTHRFAAAVSQRSIANWITFEYTAIRGYYHSIYKHATTAGQNSQLLWDCSPLKYAERAKTPTLIIHADNDHVCWLGEGLTMFAALKTANCPSKICIFHGEDHELSRSGKPSNRIRRMEEILNWFEKYLTPSANSNRKD